MTATPQAELQTRLVTLEKSAGRTEGPTNHTVEPLADPTDADVIKEFVAAYNANNLVETPPTGESTLATGTLNVYCSRLTEVARNFVLTEATTETVNGYLQELKELGRADETINGYSTALRTFYRWFDGDVNPDDIARVKKSNENAFDPSDVLTREEIQEMLDAADNPRDRAVFALLVFTGMRNNAVRTLRIKDVDVQKSRWTFNEEMEGLKGAHKNGQTRPLLGARGPVRDWLNYHPYKNDPDALLVTAKPKYIREDDNPYKPVEGSTIRRVLERTANNTDNPEILSKPLHPHFMRHTFVTVCKRDYDMDNDTIKFLLGHTPGSTVMQTTYSHLSDEDHNRKAEIDAGIRDPDRDEGTFTPAACEICGQPLPPTAKACTCGHVFAPDAVSIEAQVTDDTKKDYRDAPPEDSETVDKLDTLDSLLEDPEVKAALLEKLAAT